MESHHAVYAIYPGNLGLDMLFFFFWKLRSSYHFWRVPSHLKHPVSANCVYNRAQLGTTKFGGAHRFNGCPELERANRTASK